MSRLLRWLLQMDDPLTVVAHDRIRAEERRLEACLDEDAAYRARVRQRVLTGRGGAPLYRREAQAKPSLRWVR